MIQSDADIVAGGTNVDGVLIDPLAARGCKEGSAGVYIWDLNDAEMRQMLMGLMRVRLRLSEFREDTGAFFLSFF